MVDPARDEKKLLSFPSMEALAHQILCLCLNRPELIFKIERMQVSSYGVPPTVKQRLPNGSLRPATKTELIHMLDLTRPDFRRATLESKKLSYQTLVALMNKQAFAAVQKNPSRSDDPRVAQIAPPRIQGQLLRPNNHPTPSPTWHSPIQAMQGAGRPFKGGSV